MTSFFTRLARKPGLTIAERHQLLLYAVSLHRDGVRGIEVEASLQDRGASSDDAREIGALAVGRFEAETADAVDLPEVAALPVNLYFALGVTPRASADRIHAAYRRRAREVHPDHHADEFNRGGWNRVMTAVAEAEKVLLDADLRRAYDVMWLRRSRKVTASNATARERRGDWETRYHWYMAEVGEIEDRLAAALERGADAGVHDAPSLAGDAAQLLEEYEARVLHIRNQTYAVPEAHMGLSRRVRAELQRKDGAIRLARRELDEATAGSGSTDALASVVERLVETGIAHRQFEVHELEAVLAPEHGALKGR